MHEQQIPLNFPHSCFVSLLSSCLIPQVTFPYQHHQNWIKKTNKSKECQSWGDVNSDRISFYCASLKHNSKASVPSLLGFRGIALLEGKTICRAAPLQVMGHYKALLSWKHIFHNSQDLISQSSRVVEQPHVFFRIRIIAHRECGSPCPF